MFGIKGTPIERGTQLHFFDDGTFEFRKLPIEDSFLVEKDSKNNILRAWVMYFKLRKRFPGFKNIDSGMVTLSYGRNIVFDPFDQLSDSETPMVKGKFKDTFIQRVAESKCYQHEQKAKTSLVGDRLTVFMGILALLLGISIGIVAVY